MRGDARQCARLRGRRSLDTSGGRWQFNDAAFAHLAGIHTLDMNFCDQATITDGAFVHLAGNHTLNLWGCWQDTVTDACRTRLQAAGIPNLLM